MEREANDEQGGEGAGACVVYNPNRSLSLSQQRQRLPIFNVSKGPCSINRFHIQCDCIITCVAPQPHSVFNGAVPYTGDCR